MSCNLRTPENDHIHIYSLWIMKPRLSFSRRFQWISTGIFIVSSSSVIHFLGKKNGAELAGHQLSFSVYFISLHLFSQSVTPGPTGDAEGKIICRSKRAAKRRRPTFPTVVEPSACTSQISFTRPRNFAILPKENGHGRRPSPRTAYERFIFLPFLIPLLLPRKKHKHGLGRSRVHGGEGLSIFVSENVIFALLTFFFTEFSTVHIIFLNCTSVSVSCNFFSVKARFPAIQIITHFPHVVKRKKKKKNNEVKREKSTRQIL